MQDVPAEMTVRDYAAVVARRKWIILVATLLSTAVALGLTALQTPVYSASSQVLVESRNQDGFFDAEGNYVDKRAIETEIQIIEGEGVRRRVQENLKLAERPQTADASAVGDADVISISVRDAIAANAQTLANGYAEAYIAVRREQSVNELLAASTEIQRAIDDIQAELNRLDEDDPRRGSLVTQLANFATTLDQLRVDAALRTGGAAIVQSAEFPTVPVEPTPIRTAVLAAAVGLLMGLGTALLIEFLDNKVRSEDDLERVTSGPVLSVIPIDPPPDSRPIAVSEPAHTAVESYRSLRANLQFLGLDRPLRVIQVTSSMAGEGRTTTAANLAVVLAQSGHRVALVDADLRRPRVHEMFGIPQTPGFTDLLLGLDAKDLVNNVEIDAAGIRLSVYPSGLVPFSASELLSGRRVSQVLIELGAHYDYVIVDSAPVLPVSDAVALSGSVDGVIVVALAGRVTDDKVLESLERLDRVGAPVLGLVLNQASERSSSY